MFLDSPLANFHRIGPKQKEALEKLKIKTVSDLLYHFPVRYTDFSNITTINKLEDGQSATLFVRIKSIKTEKTWKSKIPSTRAKVVDQNNDILNIIWFHQPFLGKKFLPDETIKISGIAKISDGNASMINPEISQEKIFPIETHDNLFADFAEDETSFPVYNESKGITSRFFYFLLQKIFKNSEYDQILDPIPAGLRNTLKLPDRRTAFLMIHQPKKKTDAEVARKRFAFEYIYLLQVEKIIDRKKYEQNKASVIKPDQELVNKFISGFPFKPTQAQQKVLMDIKKDLEKDKPMSRLLEGDVGSGKTFIAAVASFMTTLTKPTNQNFGRLQVAYMAPTEVLAKQLFESFITFFDKNRIDIALVTGKECLKYPSKINNNKWTNISKTQVKKWIENGEIPVVIGTHALIQKSLKFKNLGLAIVDEQHRFGTKQRQGLVQKDGHVPHFLSMSATPIPRTLALTIYGDLDLSILDQLPSGRKSVITEIVIPAKRELIYKKIEEELNRGRQAYIICPRINEPDETKAQALYARSVISEAKFLQEKIFPKFKIGILHSKMGKLEKQKAMDDFYSHKTNILVATSVVEVGVNVPNATVIIIEGAERFGLSQLHQLRGRVKRSSHQAYCYLFSETENQNSIDRLTAIAENDDGFKLAEIDMNKRGIGDLAGNKQWGISDLAMEAIKNIKLVEIARNEAQKTVDDYSNAPFELKMEIEKRQKMHLE